ncbi:hypothetical protein BB559_001332 [Furculomyces boomerangus]|uniref:Acyl-CoA dehydrogenase n=2 Tax=Harpellales TaxID=61421 RepID=A0A2T9Z2C0_9FUNG|nr:hypothetical protein BB559_001332 [Furculomyces boomerangus]PVZ98340.1 hypothetical protein BB558_005656 [Smittium angustum]
MFPELSEKAQNLIKVLTKFVDEECIPSEQRFEEELGTTEQQRFGSEPPVVEELRVKARKLGLWNLFLPSNYKESFGLTNYEYAHMCEIMGKSPMLAPSATNCNAPDTGNMEVLARYGNEDQKKKWLVPLMDGKIRSAFAMTEPAVPSSDATNISTSLTEVEGGYLVNGRKWFIGNGSHPNLKVFITMVKSGNTHKEYKELVKKSTLGERHLQHSVVLIPKDTKGVRIVRPMKVFGFDDAPHGESEIIFNDVFIPKENVVLGLGRGFEIVQGRLGPGRLHHAMRILGMAERSLELMIERGLNRIINGTPLIEKGVIMDWISKSRIDIDSSRLLVLNAACAVDTKGTIMSKKEIALAKISVPNAALRVIDRAIQAHGAMGVCQDTPLAYFYANIRTLRIADGPDEVHSFQIAKNEVKQARARISNKSKI